ncbi:GH32 C-terminal domain-containing protein [Exiguobacterium sp. SL14]|nr:GH32 C-terminal domain-containing protein [Exiguobacterium sp. SL14]MCY1692056.1 GH32 C-terminal domain-containing protein [Exiguobacterium sp. SL14]
MFASRQFTIDRSRSGAEVPAESFGTLRSTVLAKDLHTLRLFVDRSSFELFLNDGEAVASGRIFPKGSSRGIEFSGEAALLISHSMIYHEQKSIFLNMFRKMLFLNQTQECVALQSAP